MSGTAELNAAMKEIQRLKEQQIEKQRAYEEKLKHMQEQLRQQTIFEASATGETSHQDGNVASAIFALSNVMKAQSTLFSNLNTSVNQSNAGEFVSLATSQDLIREFFGNEGPEKAQSWIEELDKTKNLYSWSDAIALNVGKCGQGLETVLISGCLLSQVL